VKYEEKVDAECILNSGVCMVVVSYISVCDCLGITPASKFKEEHYEELLDIFLCPEYMP
jgi:hypothetical protein